MDFPRHDGDPFHRGDGGWRGLAVKDDAESPFEHRMAVSPARGEDSDRAPRPPGLDNHQAPVAQHRDWGKNERGLREIHRNAGEGEGRRGRRLLASSYRRRECGGREKVEALSGKPVGLGVGQQPAAQKSDDRRRQVSAGEKCQYINGVGDFTAFFARKAAERFPEVPSAPLEKLERLVRQPVGKGRGSGEAGRGTDQGGMEGVMG